MQILARTDERVDMLGWLMLITRLRFIVAIAFLSMSSGALAQSEEDTVLAGWVSAAQPSGVFNSPYQACEAQWEHYQGNNPDSRFIGIRERGDDWRVVDCLWTQWQYLCPEEGQQGGISGCGTIFPSNARLVCPTGYTATPDQLCRSAASRERECAGPCDNNGKPNPKTANPIIVSTGAKYLEALDYSTADGQFRIARQYRSFQVGRPIQTGVLPRSLARGLYGNWNFEFGREIQLGVVRGTPTDPDATVAILLPDGIAHGFVLQSDGSWVEHSSAVFAGTSGNAKLEFVGTLPANLAELRNTPSVWRYTDKNDAVWLLETRIGPNGGSFVRGWPTSMTDRSGYAQTFSYRSDGSLETISDSLGRTATFEWSEFNITINSTQSFGTYAEPVAIERILLPDGTTLNYEFENVPAPTVPGGVYSGSKWSSTGSGGAAPSGVASTVKIVRPPVQRLAGVTRKSATDEIIDSIDYLYEHEIFGKNVTGIVDHRAKRVATFEYDGAGRVVSSERADGAERNDVEYGIDGSSRTRTLTNSLGLRTEYTFAELSSNRREYQLTAVASEATQAVPAMTTGLTYGGGTFLADTTDAEGRQFATTRDSRGRPVSVVEAVGTPEERTTTITWHSDFNVPVSIVSEGLTELRGYDGQGRLVTITRTDTTTHSVPYPTNGQARTYSYTWDANGRLLSENGPLAAVGTDDDITTFIYDASGNMLTMTNALGHVTTYGGYDANGRPGFMTVANGVTTQFAYDLLGRVTNITVKYPSDAALDATTSMSYDEVGNLTELALAGTAPLTMEYDAVNRLTAMYSAAGGRFEYSYDAMGNIERETVAHADGSTARQLRRHFDELGRLLSERLGVRTAARVGYDRVDNVTSFTDPNGFVTAASFDALDRVVSTVAPDGGVQSSSFDEQNNPLTFTDPISVTTQFTYNGFGDVIQEVSADRGTNIHEYDAAGRMTKSTDGRGQVVNYTRDFLGRITRMEPVGRPVSDVIEYHWDSGGVAGSFSTGRLAKIVDGSGQTLLGYDHRGNRNTKQQGIGTSTNAQLAYEYDQADRITQITYPSGRLVRYGYDAHGRVNLVETKENAGAPNWQVVANAHEYEPFGPVNGMALGNGLAVANEWGTDGRLEARRLFATQSGAELSHLAYRRDGVGRISAVADYVNPPASTIYGYDEVGRLTMAVAQGALVGDETYTYAPGTNRLASFSDDIGTRTIAYDGRGNTISESRPGGVAVAASYDGHGRLATYDRTNIGAQSYTYNGFGDRVRVNKPTGTRHFVYDAWGRVIAEYGASASDVKAEFIWALPPAANDNPFGGGDHIAGYAPLALVTENASNDLELYWVHDNHLGVPVVTTNAQGQVVTPSTDFLRPGFPGQSEVLSDLYYNRARDYDPVTGRYIQADPIGLAGGLNPYVYANADPVNMIDPEGEAAILIPIIVGGTIGAGSELLIQGISNYGRGRNVFSVNCYDWGEVFLAGALGATGGGASFRYLYRFGPKSLTRETGKEWSHFIPRRIVDKYTLGSLRRSLNRRGGLNGSWASPRRHYKHDPRRWPTGHRQMGDRLPPSLQTLDRIPDWLKASAASGIVGAGSTGND